MQTQQIVEGIKFVSNNNSLVNACLDISHITNDSDRNWFPKSHPELYYLDKFKKPNFLIVIEKQIHVYIIGEKDKGKTYNIIEVEGFTSTHLNITKSELRSRIIDAAREDKELYLPSNSHQRIIFIKPDYANSIIDDEDCLFVFNRQSQKGTILNKAKWSFGTDIYSPDVKSYTTYAYHILTAIFEEF